MKSLKIIIIFIASFIYFNNDVHAQDLHFSQFFEAPLVRNPALAGLFTGDIRIQGVYRNQWGAVSVPYKTGSFQIEYKNPVGSGDDYLTGGLQLIYDRSGTTNFTTLNVLPALNYHKSLSGDKNKYLSLGFMGGLVQRKIDRSKMRTNNQFDGNGYNPSLADGETFTDDNYNYYDGSVGLSFNSTISERDDQNYYIGIAYHHFNRPRNSFYKNPKVELYPRWVLSGGLKIAMNESAYFTFHGDYSKQAAFEETIAGVIYSQNLGEDIENPEYVLHLGGFIRWQDAVIPTVKLDYNKISLGISYDVNISPLKTVSQGRGGVELSISYRDFIRSNDAGIRCPRF